MVSVFFQQNKYRACLIKLFNYEQTLFCSLILTLTFITYTIPHNKNNVVFEIYLQHNENIERKIIYKGETAYYYKILVILNVLY